MQDYAPVTIGSRAGRGSGASATREAKAGQKKTPGSAGLSARLDNQTAAKLDSDEPKAPDTVGLVVGRVSLFKPTLTHAYKALMRLSDPSVAPGYRQSQERQGDESA